MIVLSAILMGISQHPIGYGFLSFFALIPIIPKLLNLKSYGKAVRYGFIWGFVYTLTTVFWISSNIGTSPSIAFFTMILSVIILLSGSVIIFSIWCALNRRGVDIWILSFIWPAIELIRSYGTLGFPWISLSNSLIEYNTVLSLDTDILCQGNFEILISDKVKGDIIAVSDSQRPYKTIEYFREHPLKDLNLLYPPHAYSRICRIPIVCTTDKDVALRH